MAPNEDNIVDKKHALSIQSSVGLLHTLYDYILSPSKWPSSKGTENLQEDEVLQSEWIVRKINQMIKTLLALVACHSGSLQNGWIRRRKNLQLDSSSWSTKTHQEYMCYAAR